MTWQALHCNQCGGNYATQAQLEEHIPCQVWECPECGNAMDSREKHLHRCEEHENE